MDQVAVTIFLATPPHPERTSNYHHSPAIWSLFVSTIQGSEDLHLNSIMSIAALRKQVYRPRHNHMIFSMT